ncbi:sigma-54 interaction domain-containing protein [Desulfogranum marinum]|uniref:sigma-54 interaction domain-containing protein n=1 Tax=Desulfogranum marinum TaxID=453220 RepID=UPI0019651581|nr:sigma-54 dependent transcriptional regulator [Desulfogranum marinum]MBM9513493.1 sigma-54-dependent Fis family transcriptional regulator [Desulfogranum marinum]
MVKHKVSVLAYEEDSGSKDILTEALAPTSNLTFRYDHKSFQQAINKNKYDVIFINTKPSNGTTFELLKNTKAQTPHTPIIITSPLDETNFIFKAIDEGAYDFIAPPFSKTRVQLVVKKALNDHSKDSEIAYLRRRQDIIYDFDAIIAKSPSFKNVITSLKKFASSDSTILITGATGTGKSFLSGTVHYNSPRRHHPFIKINCANIPETLLESELFGHEKGAFTGADKQRIGRFEQADEGTIFLDEIGEIPLEIQSKLLRVIEEKTFERVGGNKTIEVDVRVIAATNRDLQQQVNDNKFREDLFYRINVLPVPLPTLSERPLCIIPLAEKLLEKAATSLKRTIKGFSAETVDLLQHYHWPGNIRQLANTIERAIILEESDTIHIEAIHLPDINTTQYKPRVRSNEPLIVQEKELIINALEENLWVQKNAAKVLGISPRALNYKVKKFGITHPNWRRNKETQ